MAFELSFEKEKIYFVYTFEPVQVISDSAHIYIHFSITSKFLKRTLENQVQNL